MLMLGVSMFSHVPPGHSIHTRYAEVALLPFFFFLFPFKDQIRDSFSL